MDRFFFQSQVKLFMNLKSNATKFSMRMNFALKGFEYKHNEMEATLKQQDLELLNKLEKLIIVPPI